MGKIVYSYQILQPTSVLSQSGTRHASEFARNAGIADAGRHRKHRRSGLRTAEFERSPGDRRLGRHADLRHIGRSDLNVGEHDRRISAAEKAADRTEPLLAAVPKRVAAVITASDADGELSAILPCDMFSFIRPAACRFFYCIKNHFLIFNWLKI